MSGSAPGMTRESGVNLLGYVNFELELEAAAQLVGKLHPIPAPEAKCIFDQFVGSTSPGQRFSTRADGSFLLDHVSTSAGRASFNCHTGYKSFHLEAEPGSIVDLGQLALKSLSGGTSADVWNPAAMY